MKFKKYLYKLSVRIYEDPKYQRFFLRKNTQREYLRQLHPGESAEELLKTYHCRKISEFLIGFLLCLILLVFGWIWNIREQKNAVVFWQSRPEYFAGDKENTWIVRREDGSEKEIGITISEQIYTKEEAQELFSEGMEYLDSCILGENIDASHVEYPLQLPDRTEDSGITIQWITDRPDVLSSKGEILPEHKDEKGTLVQLKGIMQCQEYEAIYIKDLHVYPARKEGDIFWTKVQRELEMREVSSREEEGFSMPEEVAGEEVVFLEKLGNEFWLLSMLSLLVLFLLYWNKDEKLGQEVKLRKEQLLADYPEMVSKLTILMQAGLTARSAFERIGIDYIKQREQTGERRYSYEELLIMNREMTNGIPEEKAYEHYGKRCGVLPYMRLGGLLSQNLKKGSRHLLERLNQESQEAFAERKRRARKAGEEAGTKMLAPMGLMLVVTILIILYPAFVSFQV